MMSQIVYILQVSVVFEFLGICSQFLVIVSARGVSRTGWGSI